MMKTQEALTRFLKKCEERGLSLITRRNYQGYLRHFVDEHPELPTDTSTINKFLAKRGETPSKRGDVFKKLQAFYSYLEEFEGITSPVPARGKMGRPKKGKVVLNPATEQTVETAIPPGEKTSGGGSSVSTSTSISTADAVKVFIRSREVMGVSKRTLAMYPSYFKPFIRRYPTLPLTPEPIDEFLGSLKIDQETRAAYRKELTALYRFLEKRRHIPNPMPDVTRIPIPRKVRRVLSEDELRRLFRFAGTPQEKAVLTTLIDTKVRSGELLSMTRERLYPDKITVMGKTEERDVPLMPETYQMLCQLASSGPLFRVNGKPMNREHLRVMLRRMMERSGLTGKKLGAHILRHSASVQHMMFGGDLMSLKEELGHTQVSTTQRYAELAFPDVKKRHGEIGVLGKLTGKSSLGQPTGKSSLEKAECYGCHIWVKLDPTRVKETECPGCHQVGKWYLPNVKPEQLAFLK